MAETTPLTGVPGGNKLVEPISEIFNRKCFCVSLNKAALRQALASELESADLLALVEERCPYLFSAQPVFISDRQTERMSALVGAVESVVALPAYRQHVLASASPIARHDLEAQRVSFLATTSTCVTNASGSSKSIPTPVVRC